MYAVDMLQAPNGYKWNMGFAKDCIDVVLGIIPKFGQLSKLVHGWSTLATGSLCLGSFCHDNMVGLDVTIHASIMDQASNVASHYWHHFIKYAHIFGQLDQFNLDSAP